MSCVHDGATSTVSFGPSVMRVSKLSYATIALIGAATTATANFDRFLRDVRALKRETAANVSERRERAIESAYIASRLEPRLLRTKVAGGVNPVVPRARHAPPPRFGTYQGDF